MGQTVLRTVAVKLTRYRQDIVEVLTLVEIEGKIEKRSLAGAVRPYKTNLIKRGIRLAASTEVINLGHEKTVGCEFKAHLEAMKEADTVIAVFDPDDPRCEREAATVAVAKWQSKRIFTTDPKMIRLS
jgi:hypothetical protein